MPAFIDQAWIDLPAVSPMNFLTVKCKGVCMDFVDEYFILCPDGWDYMQTQPLSCEWNQHLIGCITEV